MSKPAKLGRKAPAWTPTRNPNPKLEPATSRNPLRELNNGHLPSAHPRRASKGRCFGFLLPNSSSSSSVSSTASSSRVPLPSGSSPHGGTPRSAPPGSRRLRALSTHGDPPGVRSRDTSRDQRPSFENPKQSRSDEHQKPASRSILQWRRAGSEGRPLRKKEAEGRGRGAAMGVPKGKTFEETLEGSSGAPKLDSTPGRGEKQAAISEVCLGFDLGEGGTPLGERSVLDTTPWKEGEQQQRQHLSHTPASTRTATPPVQASISPELGLQSALPTPACFATGHLLAGVQDRRKCRPRGILNGGGSGVEFAEGRGLGSFDARGNGCSRVSLTPPPPIEASVQWLSSPCDGESGRLRSSAVSSSSRQAYLGVCPAEASANWFLSPLEDATHICVLGDVPSAGTETVGDSPKIRSLIGISSSNFESTPSTVEICCSPTTNSSVSPFSMIIQRAAGSVSCKDHSLQGKGGYSSGLSVKNSLLLGNSHGSSNVICTPSSCSCSSRQVGPFDLQAMEEALETLNSTSPLWKLLASESEDFLPLPDPRFQSGGPSTPSNSISLACFRRPSHHQNSVKEWRLSSSELRVSWREGLISRIFEMDEFNHNPWLLDKENADCNGEEELNLKPDIKSDPNLGSSMIKEGTGHFTTNGFGSFEFVGYKQSEEKSEAKGSGSIPTSCAESISMEVDGLMASDDSDWTLFFKNHLFEV